MKLRALALLGLLSVSSCGPAASAPDAAEDSPPRDAPPADRSEANDAANDVAPDRPTADLGAPDASVDAIAAPDVPDALGDAADDRSPLDVPPSDVSLDVPSPDLAPLDGGDPDVPPPDVSSPDAPAPDSAAMDRPPPDAPALDTPSPDLPRVDAATDASADAGDGPRICAFSTSTPPLDGGSGPGSSVGAASCATATRVTAGSALLHERPAYGPGATLATEGCAPGAVLRPLYYRIELAAGQTLVVHLNGGERAFVQVMSRCAAEGCFALSAAEGADRQTQWTNTGSGPREVIVQLGFLREPTATTEASLRFEVLDAPDRACAASARVIPGAAAADFDVTPGLAASLCDNAASASVGPPRTFRVTIPPGQQLDATAASLSTGLSLALAILPSCGARSCRGFVNAAPASSQTLVYQNHGTRPLELALAVAGSPPTLAGRFSLRVSTAAPAGGSCSAAREESSGTLSAGVATAPTSLSLYSGSVFGLAEQIFRRVAVPANATLVARERPPGTSELRHYVSQTLSTGCDEPEFLPSQGFDLVWWNRGATPRSIVLGASLLPSSIPLAGLIDFASVLAPSNWSCESAREVSLPFNDSPHFGPIPLRARACATDGALLRPLYYRVTVPARHTLIAFYSAPSSTPVPIVRVLERCGPGDCANTGAPHYQYLIDSPPRRATLWANATETPRSVVVEVSGESAASFAFQTAPSADNNRCERAIPLAPGATATVAGDAYFAEERPPCCEGHAPGFGYVSGFGASYFSITVPARRWLQLRVEGRYATYMSAQVLSDCAARTLLACSTQTAWELTQAAWFNADDAPRAVIVAAGRPAIFGPPLDPTHPLRVTASFSDTMP